MNPASHQSVLLEFQTFQYGMDAAVSKPDKLHAIIHFIERKVVVPVKTPLVYESQDTAFTQIDTGPLFATTAARAASSQFSPAPPMQGGTA